MDSGITELTTVGGRPFSIEKARQNGYVNKFDGLSLRDKQELELLWINNFDEVKTYNELFPDKKDITKDESKRKYFYINN